MVLSDELVKVNGLVESVVNKVRRQLFEMGAINGGDTHEARPLALALPAPLSSPRCPNFRYTRLTVLQVHGASLHNAGAGGGAVRALPTSRAAPDACSGRRQVTVEGVPPDTYLERFAWNEAKYPPRRPLKETVAAITETAQKLEDELKARARLCCPQRMGWAGPA